MEGKTLHFHFISIQNKYLKKTISLDANKKQT